MDIYIYIYTYVYTSIQARARVTIPGVEKRRPTVDPQTQNPKMKNLSPNFWEDPYGSGNSSLQKLRVCLRQTLRNSRFLLRGLAAASSSSARHRSAPEEKCP